MSELLFEYKVRYRYKTGYKEFIFYATTEIEEFLNRNNIEYVRNMADTVEHRLFKEIERLNKELETLKQPQVFIDTQDMEERYGGELYKEYLEKENKRLNNIINELEEYFVFLKMNSTGGNKEFFEDILDFIKALKELKGSDKE